MVCCPSRRRSSCRWGAAEQSRDCSPGCAPAASPVAWSRARHGPHATVRRPAAAHGAGMPRAPRPRRAARHLTAGDLVIERGFIGEGYGASTPEGKEPSAGSAARGHRARDTYTAKCLAALLHHGTARLRDRPLLFWNTFSSVEPAMLRHRHRTAFQRRFIASSEAPAPRWSPPRVIAPAHGVSTDFR